jgi:glycosyltransferase involved in cell wall biosynthesis
LISVLLPTYNQARFLPDCLASLAAQTRQDFELIACDDGSTDGTAGILKAANVRTVTHPKNRGTAAAINSAAALATAARYMTWVSSDNMMHPDWLKTLAGFLDDHPESQAVYSPYCRHDLFPDTGKVIPHQIAPGPYARDRLIGSLDCYFGPSFLVRRPAWMEHRDGMAHDYDWWLRFEETTDAIGYCPAPLCDYRMGPWQTGRAKPANLIEDARRRQAEAKDRRGIREGPPVFNPGVKNRNLSECIKLATAGCDFVVELGCGFGNRLQEINAAVRVGVDAHEPYIAEARMRYPDTADDFLVRDAHDYIRQFIGKGRVIDAILMVDFIEHLTVDAAKSLLSDCKQAASRIVLYVPLGQHPQTSDPYGMGGDHWQTHRSTWEPEALEAMGFNVMEWPTAPNRPGLAPRAAFCVWGT